MNKKFSDLLTSVDVLNTLNGGVSEPYVSIRQQNERHQIRIRVPGVALEGIQVEINNNELSVFYLIPVQTTGKLVHMPQIVYNHSIPYFIEVSKIKAIVDDRELVVDLPFNKLSGGYNKKIQVEEE